MSLKITYGARSFTTTVYVPAGSKVTHNNTWGGMTIISDPWVQSDRAYMITKSWTNMKIDQCLLLDGMNLIFNEGLCTTLSISDEIISL